MMSNCFRYQRSVGLSDYKSILMRRGLSTLLCFMCLCTLPLPTYAASSKECRSIEKKYKDQIRKIRKDIPKTGAGAQISVGKCAKKLKKYYGNLLCCRTHKNIAPYWERISCIRLEMISSIRLCKCGRTHDTSSSERNYQKAKTTYRKIKKAANIAKKLGIKNYIIKRIVKISSSELDCANEKTLKKLHKIENDIKEIINE